MIVKVSQANGRWLTLGDVRTVDYGGVAHSVCSGDELDSKIAEVCNAAGAPVRNALIDIDWENPPPTIQPDHPFKFGSFVVEHNDGHRVLVFFDHPVYLCDNKGDTVEKIRIR